MTALAQDAIGLGLKTLFSCQRPPTMSAPACSGPVVLEGRFHFQRGAAKAPREILQELRARVVVELIGIEPTTSGLQSPRSPS